MPGQEANGNNSAMSFWSFIKRYDMCTHKSSLDDAILMSTHSIHFYDKVRNHP